MKECVAKARAIRKVMCDTCNGTGSSGIESQFHECSECKGLGWIEVDQGEEAICPKCNGDGQVKEAVTVPCSACNSKGYAVRIIEYRLVPVKCKECDGEGEIETYEDCPKCDGVGLALKDDGFLNEWIDCSKCHGASQIMKYVSCEDCNGHGYTDRLTEIDITPQRERIRD